jgi:hypothetical protein
MRAGKPHLSPFQEPHMKLQVVACALALALPALPALAQKPAAGAAVVASEPGKAVIAETVEASAKVVAIDKATRTVTLRTAQGKSFDVVAGDEVKRFDEIKLGDLVVVRYFQALTMELMKTKAGKPAMTEREGAARAPAGERPGGAIGREVTAVLDVLAVDPKKMTITVKGPRGNVVDLQVQNPDHFKVVKKSDQIEAVYREAVAVSLEPAPTKPAAKPAAKK